MGITAKVQDGRVTLPAGLDIPDGTEVEILIPKTIAHDHDHGDAVSLPVFSGDGLQPDVNLDDSRAMRRILDDPVKLSQLP
jgi:hypothetical protein